MMLQELDSYYHRKVKEEPDSLPPYGFERKEIPFVITLNEDGAFFNLEDRREIEGRTKRARSYHVPQGPLRSGSNSWKTAYLLWDHAGYILGYSKEDPENEEKSEKAAELARKQHKSFVSLINETFPDTDDPGVIAVKKFLSKGDYAPLFEHENWKELAESKGNISFQLRTDFQLICQREAVIEAVKLANAESGDEKGLCLVSGEEDEIEKLHQKIKGVYGAQTSGANIVSFNCDAFESYGKKQGFNSPVGKKVAFNYTTALNHLLQRDSQQKISLGDMTVVFWAEQRHEIESALTNLFSEAPKDDPDRNASAIKALYAAPWKGKRPMGEDDPKFFILGLSPNAARISIRLWKQTTVGALARNVIQFFDDIKIAHASYLPEYPALPRLLRSMAVQGKSENVLPNMAGDIFDAIILNTPFPWSLLSAVINRNKAERKVSRERAALLKAFLNRQSKEEIKVALDKGNTNIGYRLGRLFATLEKIQEEANPGLNTTIRDSHYGSASSNPVMAFPTLMKLKNHHLRKMENKGRVVNLEKLIAEIASGLDGEAGYPSQLALPDQGRFDIGYYHQRQDFFTKTDNNNSEGEDK